MKFASLLRLITSRTLAAVPVLIGVVIGTFVLVRLLPGDPIAYLASSPNMTQEQIEHIRGDYGLDRSIPEQLLLFLRSAAEGDLGVSMITGRPVLTDLLERLPASMELSLVALGLAMALAVPLGVASAVFQGSLVDHGVRLLAVVGTSSPPFVTGIILILVFYFVFPIAPAPVGRIDIFLGAPLPVTNFFLIDAILAPNWAQFRSATAQIVLPAATMAILVLAPIMRITRGAMIATLASDYVRTAQAAGLSGWTVYVRYALRNAIVPIITTTGIVFSFMLSANVLVEKVFSWPGIGSYTLQAMTVSDYAPIQGFVLMVGFIYILINLAIDILCSLIDPRLGME